MTPEDKDHVAKVARIKADWDTAIEELQAAREAVGLVAKDVRPFPEQPIHETDRPVPLTPERMEEIQALERKVDTLEQEFADATRS